jgi:hypothetical protein
MTEPEFRVRWLQVWRHRWLMLNLINQMAHGSPGHIRALLQLYGGSPALASRLYDAARDIIVVDNDRLR